LGRSFQVKEVLMRIFRMAGVFLIGWGSLVVPSVAAESAVGKKAGHKPIDLQLQVGGRVQYSYDGMELKEYKPFEEVIFGLNDPHATRFLKSAAADNAVSWPLIIGGGLLDVAACVDFVVRYRDYRETGNTQNYTLSWSLLGAGLTAGVIGYFIQEDAQVNKFNAVKRYNAVVRGEAEVSMIYLPERKALGLGLVQRF